MNVIELSGYVGDWYFDPNIFKQQLKDYQGDVVYIDITSSGGSYFAALDIVNVMRKDKRKKVCQIGAYAMSAATHVAMGCDEIEVASNAILMFHKPKVSTYVEGDSDELMQLAKLSDLCYNSYKELFMARTGKSSEEVDDLLEEDLYCSAEQALELGLINRVTPAVVQNDSVTQFKLPEVLMAVVQRKNKELNDMALKDVCQKFGVTFSEGKEEEALSAFIQTMRDAAPLKKAINLPGSIVQILVKNREMELDALVQQGFITPAVAGELKKTFTAKDHITQNVDEDGNIQDAFDSVIQGLKLNEKVVSYEGKAGVRQLGDSSKGQGQENVLVSNMESRTNK